MKIWLSIFAAASTLAALTYPASAHNFGTEIGIYSEVITGLDDSKYYTVTAKAENGSINSDAFVFAGTERTVIPAGESTVYLRGIKPVGGQITAGAVSGGSYDVTVSDISVEPGQAYTFYQGGDITEANYIASLGGKYYDTDKNEGDPIKILAENGIGMARIRLSNKPGKGNGDGVYYLPEGYQDLNDCLDLAKRAKDNGMAIEFTFNLSDYWSNAERQLIPSEWVEKIKTDTGKDITDAAFLRSMTNTERDDIVNRLCTIIYEHVKDVMTRLKEQGTPPEYVSIGNEINGGILFPFGPSFDMQINEKTLTAVWGDDKSENDIPMPAQTESLAKMMNAGYDAVKEISPESQVVIHLANGAKLSSYTWALDIYNNAGVKYDILGASYYPAWSNNTVEGCVEFCNEIYKQYQKPILIMETGFNWNAHRKDGFGGQLIDIDAYKDKYPPTKDGQKGYLADLYNGLKSVDNGACIGAIYWDPLMIHVEDSNETNASLSGWAIAEADDKTQVNVVENTTLFDFDGNALPSLTVTRGGVDILTTENDISLSNKLRVNGKDIEAEDSFILQNGSDKTKSAAIVIVKYDENNKLCGTSISSVTLDSGEFFIHTYNNTEKSKLFAFYDNN